jgi:predicted DNA-binding transcriptional regulator YafY
MAAFVLVVFIGLWIAFSFKIALIGTIALFVVVGVGLLALATSGNTDDPAERKRARAAEREGFAVKANLRITYEDRNGERTTRAIRAMRYTDTSPGRIYAYCKLRKGNRTFITDRVKEAVDLDTGEIIRRIPTYFRAKGREDETQDQR